MPLGRTESQAAPTDTAVRNKASFEEYRSRNTEAVKALERATQSYEEVCEEHRKTALQFKDYMQNVDKETADAFYRELEAGKDKIAKEFEKKAKAAVKRF